jgi:hypothetical protein
VRGRRGLGEMVDRHDGAHRLEREELACNGNERTRECIGMHSGVDKQGNMLTQ